MTNTAEKPHESDAKAFDPLAFSAQAIPLLEKANGMLAGFLQKHSDDFSFQARIGAQASAALTTAAAQWMRDPVKLMQAQVGWWQEYVRLLQECTKRWAGDAVVRHAPTARDKRFTDEAWQQNALFDLIKQSYLLTSHWAQALVKETPDIDARTQQKISFYTRQFVDAMSPTNFWLTNPAVLRKFAETGGESFIQGLRNMLRDMEAGEGQLRISMTDVHAYHLGKNIATTPGSVVFRNDLIELIQYTPTTPDVNKAPLLVIPPWINKYYILDLRADNSFVRYAVEQGHTVFMVSWINPTTELSEKNFADYMRAGVLEALDAIDSICGTVQTNVIGYCIGGTLLAATLAHLTALGKESRVKSATYFVTMIDFTDPGDLGVFIDEEQITALETLMFEKGVLPASAMGATFNILRANDLIWSFVVNNYMLGQDPLPFDLLYWNADSTNMPAAMHSYYLRKMYLENKLAQPNGLALLGTPIDVRTIETPSYIISTRDDHIAPWQSTYAATQLYSGDIQFVLGGSGHIAGIVNPPASNKYQYWTNAATPADSNEWLANATEHKGSWWPHWAAWSAQHSGGKVPARTVGSTAYPPLEPAPGSYVKVRA